MWWKCVVINSCFFPEIIILLFVTIWANEFSASTSESKPIHSSCNHCQQCPHFVMLNCLYCLHTKHRALLPAERWALLPSSARHKHFDQYPGNSKVRNQIFQAIQSCQYPLFTNIIIATCMPYAEWGLITVLIQPKIRNFEINYHKNLTIFFIQRRRRKENPWPTTIVHRRRPVNNIKLWRHLMNRFGDISSLNGWALLPPWALLGTVTLSCSIF